MSRDNLETTGDESGKNIRNAKISGIHERKAINNNNNKNRFDPLTCKIAALFYFIGWGKSMNISNRSVNSYM